MGEHFRDLFFAIIAAVIGFFLIVLVVKSVLGFGANVAQNYVNEFIEYENSKQSESIERNIECE